MCHPYRCAFFLPAFLVAGLLPALAQAETPAKIITLGDSITRGVRQGVKEDQTFAHLLGQGLGKEGVKAEVINVGLGGERTDQALKRLEKDILAKRPVVVTIMYGTNDSYVDKGAKAPRITEKEYRNNLEKLVDQLGAAKVIPILMTEPCWGDKADANGIGEHPNLRLEKYVKACREVAKAKKIPLVDHFKIWSDKSKEGFDIGKWTTDQCHPNPEGHRVLADAILPVVKEAVLSLKKE